MSKTFEAVARQFPPERVASVTGVSAETIRRIALEFATALRELAAAEREAGAAWLARSGDPYLLSVVDADGRVGMDYGVYGVPETFVIDKAGIVRYKHIGPLTEVIVNEKIIPLVKELKGA